MSDINSSNSNITIDGVCLTPELINTLRQWQSGYVQSDLNTVDDAIECIASSLPDDDKIKEAWDLVFRLTQLKGYLKTIKPKE